MSIKDAKITQISNELSISLDEDGPVLLFIPNAKSFEHYHIELDKDAAYKLLVWLENTRLDWA
jgi:hypothetical protein